MKAIAFALMLALSSPLAGCNTPSVADVAPVPITVAEKALTIAHLAYNGAGTSLKAAADSNVLLGANAATARVWYDKAGDSLKVADAADAAANAQGIMAAVASAEDALARASALINPTKK